MDSLAQTSQSHSFGDEERFRALADLSPDIVSIFDCEGRLIFNSAAAWKTHGYRADELNGISTFDLIHPDDRLQVEDAFGRLLKKQADSVIVQYRYRNADGSYTWMEASGRNELANPRLQGIIAISRDISERKRAEEEIRHLNVDLEKRISERTDQFFDIIQRLQREIDERKQAEEHIRVISSKLNEACEKERSSIARELHDEIGQLLTGLKIMVTMLSQRLTSPAPNELQQIQETVQELMMRVREMSINLRPPVLDCLGLLEALTFTFSRYRARTEIEVKFTRMELARRLSPSTETALFRVIQEALTNVARHADVKEVLVELWIEEHRVGLIIEDHGKGFDLATLPPVTCGLSGMDERITTLRGKFEIDSKPGKGTRVQVWLPLEWA